jgi:hypothetical protein
VNAGFSNLSYLKDRLLLASDASGSDLDDAVLALGRAVAGLFESECDRTFGRAVNAVYEAPADRDYVIVPRYPLESVTSAEVRDNLVDGWRAADLLNILPLAGVVYFVGDIGVYGSTARITYTGGYWWDETENNTGTQPAGSTIIPQGLVLLWVQFCKYLWDRSSIENSAKAGFASELEKFITKESDLPEFVKRGLMPYRRMAA